MKFIIVYFLTFKFSLQNFLLNTRSLCIFLVVKLHVSLNYDQFSVLCANTRQFFKFTFKILKLLKVLKITTCFRQYGHPQVLKSSGGNCYSAATACVPSMRTYVVLGVLCSLLFSVTCSVLNALAQHTC
jgi:hypothetical protein